MSAATSAEGPIRGSAEEMVQRLRLIRSHEAAGENEE